MINYVLTATTSRRSVSFTLSVLPEQEPEVVARETMAVLGFSDMTFTLTEV